MSLPYDQAVTLPVKVYAYLKRLGFVLTRAKSPTPDYPAAPPLLPAPVTAPGMWKRFTKLLSRLILSILGAVLQRSPWKPVGLRGLKSSSPFFLSAFRDGFYLLTTLIADVFAALRFLRCGHTAPLHKSSATEGQTTQSPVLSTCTTSQSEQPQYNVFFHVYKPSTPFRKSTPPAPDFYVVVIKSDIYSFWKIEYTEHSLVPAQLQCLHYMNFPQSSKLSLKCLPRHRGNEGSRQAVRKWPMLNHQLPHPLYL